MKDSETMQKKIDAAEKLQSVMKGCNKIIRSKKLTEDKKKERIKETYSFDDTEIRKLFAPDFSGDIGYPHYRLSNNTANIRRMKQRVIALKKKESTPTSETSFPGGRIIDHAGDDRVQIDFDSHPSDEMIAKLRGEGWRWAPSVQLWQRARTPAAMESAKRITETS